MYVFGNVAPTYSLIPAFSNQWVTMKIDLLAYCTVSVILKLRSLVTVHVVAGTIKNPHRQMVTTRLNLKISCWIHLARVNMRNILAGT